MANFDTIKTAIDANIKTNGTQDITGGKMNSILKQMVDATDAELTELESKLGVSGQFEVNDELTLLWLDVSSWERKAYKLKVTFVGENSPSYIRIIQQPYYAGENLTDVRVYPNEWVDLSILPEANGILFFLGDAFTYTLKYEIFPDGQVFENAEDIEEIEKQLKQNNETLDRLLVQTSGLTKVVDYETNPISTISPAYVSDSNGTIKIDIPNYGVQVYNVNPGEEYKILLSSQLGTAKVYAIYDSTDVIDASTFVVGTDVNVNETHEVSVRIPERGKALVVTNYRTGKAEVRRVLNLLPSPKDAAILYSIQDESIEVQKISGKDILCITLAKGGGNNLFDFRAFKKITDDGVTNQFHYNGSDWFAPFKLDAIYNADGDDPTANSFTGGAHQYNNLATGSTPTARMVDIEFKVDGRIITEGVGFAQNISIKWTNLIQANNTRKADGSGREVLKQIITLEFNGLEWNTETELIPLEDITMKLWYGYQMTGVASSLSNHWKFINGANREDDVEQAGNNLACAMIAFGGIMDVRMELDTNFDIGDRRFCYEASTNSAFKSGNKGYFSIVNKPTEMKANYHYYIRGKYILTLNES